MRTSLIAISVVMLFLFGCSHDQSTVPQPLGNVQSVENQFDSPPRNFKVLYFFQGGADGGNPLAGLIRDAAGNLYGTTVIGGTFSDGVVFKVDARGNETVLHSFSGADGNEPGDLTQDADGNLYGTAFYGGNPVCQLGCGVVFKLDASGNETVLHSFTGADGQDLSGGMVRDSEGSSTAPQSTGAAGIVELYLRLTQAATKPSSIALGGALTVPILTPD